MEFEKEQIRSIGQAHHEIRRACGRSTLAVQVGRQQAGYVGRLLKADLGCGSACQHFRPVVGARHRTSEFRRKDIEGSVVRVWPDAELGIVREVTRGELESVAM